MSAVVGGVKKTGDGMDLASCYIYEQSVWMTETEV